MEFLILKLSFFFSKETVDTGGELLEINLLCQIVVSAKSWGGC